jgi:hypothetical protein
MTAEKILTYSYRRTRTMKTTRSRFTPSLLMSALLLAAAPAQADEAELRAKIEMLEQQLQAIKTELAKIDRKAEEATARTEALAEHQEATPAAGQPASSLGSQTSVNGYGEIAYTRPRNNASGAQVDLTRAVIGIGHRFNDRLKFVGEFEFEHAITSADDSGEVAVEQLYVDYTLNSNVNMKAGLFLIPMGLLNENHEPTHYQGVFRPEVETRIIPTTWREVGLGFYGATESGIQYDLGITSSFSLHGWDAAESPSAPLSSIHQEGQFANMRDIAFYGALHYIGVPGLRLGGSIWSGNSTQGNGPFIAGDSTADLAGISGRITLWSADAVYAVGNLDLRGLYARGTIGQAGAINDVLVAPANGFTNGFVPSTFDGGYAQAAYRVYENDSLSVTPFLRWEFYDTQRKMPSGYTAFVDPNASDRVTTIGASLHLRDGVVFKADYQDFRTDNTQDRFNLGVGYAF